MSLTPLRSEPKTGTGEDESPGDVPGGDDLPGDDNGAGDDDLPGDDNGTGDDDLPGDDNGAGDDDLPGDDNGTGDDDLPGDDNGTGDDDLPGDDNGTGDDDLPGDDNGNDLFQASGGDDFFDGGAGIDVVLLARARDSYQYARSDDGALVVSGEGIDVLANVERLVFADCKLAFDLDGAAGATAKLIGALFGAEALGNAALVTTGLRLFDAGMSSEAVAQLALPLLPGADDDFVRLLYTNVAGVAPSDDAAAYFTGLLAAGAQTRVSLVMLAADSELNRERVDLVGLAAGGLEYA